MKTNGISNPARKLHSALIQRGLNVEIEKWDSHKHIDLSIDSAGLNIEIDGDAHYTDPDTILRDLRRDYYSTEDDFDTIHIPNVAIENHLDEVADALTKVVISRIGTFDESIPPL
jgi:very-short-patch-repair endonuclease